MLYKAVGPVPLVVVLWLMNMSLVKDSMWGSRTEILVFGSALQRNAGAYGSMENSALSSIFRRRSASKGHWVIESMRNDQVDKFRSNHLIKCNMSGNWLLRFAHKYYLTYNFTAGMTRGLRPPI